MDGNHSGGLGLVGDIGGTNARFALVEFDGQDPRLIEPTAYKGEDYDTAEDAIEAYLHKVGVKHPDQAVVAVAGPIDHGQVHMTNLDWRISEDGLRRAGGFRNAKLINDSIAKKPKDMVACMHLCRGNFAGHWVAEGGYEPVAEVLFNEMNIDGYFLEYDSERAGGFEPLRYLPKGKVAVLGLVTTKSPKLETKDELKRRIEAAAKFAPLDQLALSPQCGFSSGIGGETMTVDIEKRKLALIVETARDVWGSA